MCVTIVSVASGGQSKGQICWLLSRMEAYQLCGQIAGKGRLEEWWRLLHYWCWYMYCCVTSMITSMPPPFIAPHIVVSPMAHGLCVHDESLYYSL